MSINTYDFVHLALQAMGGSVQGKTKLQKTMYFLGILTEHQDDLGFRAHFYGPYSDEVTNAIGQLCSLGFVDTNTTVWGIDSRGFEMTRTDYSLNEDGRRIADIKCRQNPELWQKITKAVQFLKNAGDLDYMKLSIAAKTFFMLGQKEGKEGKASQEQLVLLAGKFGWKVTPEQITEAAGFLQSLKLVEVS